MDVILDRVCGRDVHRDMVKACVRVSGEGRKRQQTLATFGTKTADLLGLRDWLEQWQVTDVAMESTGEYWKAVYYMLEDRFQTLLVNAAHIKNVPGRKTDAKDGAWIAQLLECGLLRGSFVPPPPIRELRDLTRYRKRLVEQRTEEVLRLHGVLQRAGIKLSSAVSNILGVSGRAMLEALVEGKQDASAMAELARGSLRGKLPLLRKALEGHFTAHHRVMVTQMLGHIDYLEEAIASLSQEVDERLKPFHRQHSLLKTIPGFQNRTADVVISEIGVDMGRFPSERHLASLMGVCPGNNRSAGKRKPEKIRRGGRWLKPALTEAAWAAVRQNDSYLSAQYHRLVPHKGKKKAIVAVCHSILIAAYHMLKNDVKYHDLGADFFIRRNQQAIQRRCLRQLQELGFEVELKKVA
jgi:transposase